MIFFQYNQRDPASKQDEGSSLLPPICVIRPTWGYVLSITGETFWEENDIFQKSMDKREGCQEYMFYDGPPTANGKPHIGHVLTRVIKDMIPRYRTMKGYYVPRKAGWDTHGLPVELEVEKMLGLDGKEQIEEYGVEPFI